MDTPPAGRPGKRRNDRSARRISVKFGEARPDRLGYANNVSADGLYLQGARYKPGTLLVVEAQIKGETFLLMTQVRWTTAGPAALMASSAARGVGLRILNPSPEWQLATAAFRSSAA